MYIAVDDTYGPKVATGSRFVTGNRRTHVAVVFPDDMAQYVRDEVTGCLEEVSRLFGVSATEFHFVDIYNRNPPWNTLPPESNLIIFEFFASIYRRYRWLVHVQTIDDRTFRDHGQEGPAGHLEGLNLSDRADQSLLMLLIKVRARHQKSPEPITLYVDQSRRQPGVSIGSQVFRDWPEGFRGMYASSAAEPLLQIADFISFCINRSTHLSVKQKRTEIDTWFLNLVGGMGINSEDIRLSSLPEDFTVADFDREHSKDRKRKGL